MTLVEHPFVCDEKRNDLIKGRGIYRNRRTHYRRRSRSRSNTYKAKYESVSLHCDNSMEINEPGKNEQGVDRCRSPIQSSQTSFLLESSMISMLSILSRPYHVPPRPCRHTILPSSRASLLSRLTSRRRVMQLHIIRFFSPFALIYAVTSALERSVAIPLRV